MIGLIAPLMGAAVKTMCMSMLSEELLKRVILILLKRLVESTKNEVDDQILQAYENALTK
tara:strand:- start:1120 stop:1299 length:180 start_codon:yes stop_codon:yes gene_type:complete